MLFHPPPRNSIASNRLHPSVAIGVRASVFLVILVCMATESAWARCGSASRQLLWRHASSEELIRWDGSTATADPMERGVVMSHDEDGERECSRCRCRRDGEPHRPLDVEGIKTISMHVIAVSRAAWIRGLDSRSGRIVPSDTLGLSQSLSVLERPPRA
jgi:hypothetical protein